MPNIIELNLLNNKSIVAKMQGIPLANENSYKIIAGEENATKFVINSIPSQYANARFTVEMVNAKGFGIEETDITNLQFTLPVGMAVAGYGYISIKAYLGNEKVPFQSLKVKVWNTLPQWKENINKAVNARVENGYLIITENNIDYNVGYVKGESGETLGFRPSNGGYDSSFTGQEIEDRLVKAENADRKANDLYSILVQTEEIAKREVEDTYSSRETANGLNIADGVNTEVLSIKGDTIKSNNLCKSFESGTLDTTNGQPVANPARLRTTPIKIKANTVYYLSFDTSQVMLANGCLYYEDGRFHSFDRYPSSTNHDGVISFPIDGYYVIIFRKLDGNNIEDLTIGNIQFEEGSTKTPYTPYFEGLKNAKFKSITSCGKNLFSIGLFRKNEFELVGGFYRSKKPLYLAGTYAWRGVNFNSTIQGITVVLVDKNNNAKAFLVNNGTIVSTATITSTTPLYLAVNYSVNVFVNNSTIEGQLEIGTATEYEPYKEDNISLSNEVELQKFDTAYPQENKIVRGSKTIVLNGTESWRYSTDLNKIDLLIETYALNTQANEGICNRLEYTLNETKKGIHAYGGHLYLTQALSNTYTSIADWKSQLSAWANEGNPLTITYTVQTPTEEKVNFNKSSYMAWKGGSETINQGATDNSEYGAENTVKQDYYEII